MGTFRRDSSRDVPSRRLSGHFSVLLGGIVHLVSLGTTREGPPDSPFDDHPTGVRPGFIFTSGTDLGITAPVPRVPVCNDAGFDIFQFSKLQPLKTNRCTQPLAERGNLLNSRIDDGIRKLADANSSVELVVRSTNATWVAFPDYYTRRRPSTPSSPSSSSSLSASGL